MSETKKKRETEHHMYVRDCMTGGFALLSFVSMYASANGLERQEMTGWILNGG